MTFVISGLTPPPILKKDDKLFLFFFLVQGYNWVTFVKKKKICPFTKGLTYKNFQNFGKNA